MSDELQEPHWADPAMQEGPPPDEPVPDFPEFVKLGETAMRYEGNGKYHKPAGHWRVKAMWNRAKQSFVVVPEGRGGQMRHADGRILTECSEEYYREDNRGYV